MWQSFVEGLAAEWAWHGALHVESSTLDVRLDGWCLASATPLSAHVPPRGMLTLLHRVDITAVPEHVLGCEQLVLRPVQSRGVLADVLQRHLSPQHAYIAHIQPYHAANCTCDMM